MKRGNTVQKKVFNQMERLSRQRQVRKITKQLRFPTSNKRQIKSPSGKSTIRKSPKTFPPNRIL